MCIYYKVLTKKLQDENEKNYNIGYNNFVPTDTKIEDFLYLGDRLVKYKKCKRGGIFVLNIDNVKNYPLWSCYQYCTKSVSVNGFSLEYVKFSNEEIIWLALRNNPVSIVFVKNPLPEMIEYVLSKDKDNIRFLFKYWKKYNFDGKLENFSFPLKKTN